MFLFWFLVIKFLVFWVDILENEIIYEVGWIFGLESVILLLLLDRVGVLVRDEVVLYFKMTRMKGWISLFCYLD